MTRQQRWSREAFQRVGRVSGTAMAPRYNSLARKAPTLIQSAGLMQAITFMISRGGEGKAYVDDLAGTFDASWSHRNLRSRAESAPLQEYLALTRDLIHIGVWFRRYAQIELGEEEQE